MYKSAVARNVWLTSSWMNDEDRHFAMTWVFAMEYFVASQPHKAPVAVVKGWAGVAATLAAMVSGCAVPYGEHLEHIMQRIREAWAFADGLDEFEGPVAVNWDGLPDL